VRHPRPRGGDRVVGPRRHHVSRSCSAHHRRMAGEADAPARHLRGQARSRLPRVAPRHLAHAQGRGDQGLCADRGGVIADYSCAIVVTKRMIPKSGNRFSDKIMRNTKSLPTHQGENRMSSLRLTLAAAAATLLFAGSANAAEIFTLSTTSFKDGALMPKKMAGDNKANPNCVGENVSPQLSWSNPPAGTVSYALIMTDPEGRAGLGVDHWHAYGIPASVTSMAEG